MPPRNGPTRAIYSKTRVRASARARHRLRRSQKVLSACAQITQPVARNSLDLPHNDTSQNVGILVELKYFFLTEARRHTDATGDVLHSPTVSYPQKGLRPPPPYTPSFPGCLRSTPTEPCPSSTNPPRNGERAAVGQEQRHAGQVRVRLDGLDQKELKSVTTHQDHGCVQVDLPEHDGL